MTVTVSWFVWPLGLLIAAAILIERGSRETGMMGGVVHFLIAVGLVIGAIVSVIVRMWP